jgi:hypothetical protein
VANYTQKYQWPDDDELLELLGKCGSFQALADAIGSSRGALMHRVRTRKLVECAAEVLRPAGQVSQDLGGAAGVKETADTLTVTLPSGSNPELGDYDDLLRERGLDPGDWTVVSVKANKWNAMTSDKATGDNRIVEMHQWTITLKPSPHRVLILPAVHVPVVKRTSIGPPSSEKPELIVVEGDHQAPYHDPRLHEASVAMLRELAKKHRLAEHVFLGDTMDFPTISRHADHPNAVATPNECLQAGYNILREKREAAPNIRVRKLKGNHDWRIEGEQLSRSERMYGIRPAQEWEADEPEIPALHLNRLLHLDALGIELIEDPRGWQHAEVELVPGMYGLVVRHGWLTGAKTAAASVTKRGRSIIVGHIHRREHSFVWDPSAGCERQGVVSGTMSLVRDEDFGHFAPLDNWLQGCVVVTRWPDGDFCVEHAKYSNGALRWRDHAWAA